MIGRRILDRYVLGEFLRLFVSFCMSTPVLFILGDLTDNLDSFRARDLTGAQIVLNYVYQLPLFVLYAFPIAALIATVFTVNAMTRHSEIAAAKAGGISFQRLYGALPLLGVVLTFAALGLSELVPITNRLRAAATGQADRGTAARGDFIYREQDGHVYAIRQLLVENERIYGLTVEREGNEPVVPGIEIVARQAVFGGGAGGAPGAGGGSGGGRGERNGNGNGNGNGNSNGTGDGGDAESRRGRGPERAPAPAPAPALDRPAAWTLTDGYMRLFYGPGREVTFQFDSLRQAGFTETPEQLLAEPREPDDMGYEELGRFIEILERSGGEPLELKVERAQKIALPVATLVIILFAAPLATSSRRGGAAYGVGVSLAVTIIYLMLFKIAGAAGASGALPPMVAAWIPNAVFAAAAVVLLARVRT